MQPGHVGQSAPWTPQIPAIPNCPPGLEYLTGIDNFLVHQQVELLEAFTGFEGANKYEIKNCLGQRVYLAVEKTDCCTRQVCGNQRPFEICVYDVYQREVLKAKRYLRCDSCLFPCCLNKLEVFTAQGELVGSVHQRWSVCVPEYEVKDSTGNTVLCIEGPCLTCSCGGDVEFSIKDRSGSHKLGSITKQWSGIVKEFFTDSDNFRCAFPLDLDVKDFMFFEKEQGNSDDGIGMIS